MMNYILFLDKITSQDKDSVGSKAYSLFKLSEQGLNIAPGFVLTPQALDYFFKQNNLYQILENELKLYNLKHPQGLSSAAERIQNLIRQTPMPTDFKNDIFKSYDKLTKKNHKLAIRCSFVDDNSFGKNQLFLNITGENNLLYYIKEIWASQFTSNNLNRKITTLIKQTAVLVQVMLEVQVSGLIHTINFRSKHKDQMVIEALWGLFDIYKKYDYAPDRYLLDKDNLEIISKKTYPQDKYLINGKNEIIEKDIPLKKINTPKLVVNEILELGKLAQKIKKSHFYPQTTEWILSDNKFYFMQTQPLFDFVDQKTKLTIHDKVLDLPVILEAHGQNRGICHGRVVFFNDSPKYKMNAYEIAVLTSDKNLNLANLENCKGIIFCLTDPDIKLLKFAQTHQIPLISGAKLLPYRVTAQSLITMDGQNGLIYKGFPDSQHADLVFSRDYFFHT